MTGQMQINPGIRTETGCLSSESSQMVIVRQLGEVGGGEKGEKTGKVCYDRLNVDRSRDQN